MTDGLCDNMDDYFYSIDATLQYDFIASLLKPPIRGINHLSRVNFISSSSDDIIFIVFSYELIILVGKKHNSIGLFEIDLFSTKSNSWKLIGNFPPYNFFFEGDIVTTKGIIYITMMTNLSRSMNEFIDVLFSDQVQKFQDPILYILGENLCLTRMRDLASQKFEVWNIKKDGSMSNTWSKILMISSMLCGRCLRPVSLMKIDGYICF
ncbi:hypothetical protein R3W88_025739 [Solanum pinnatisectum]|uniref:Uncharacterized protein n=1 Tax=Solanum pinnatisectum TaxID=50273 RepID=A0AAV9M4K6_9SOLN|nr:hypothetical protein R3W88_025739 [Solanum pinnatisectum]